MPFREWLREYPGIPRVAPRMAFSLRECFFPKVGVVSGFLMLTFTATSIATSAVKQMPKRWLSDEDVVQPNKRHVHMASYAQERRHSSLMM